MANRFYVPDAVSFEGVQLYQPNFEMLNTVLASKQERWDLVSDAAKKMPQAFGSIDQQRRAEKIKENDQRMSDLGATFKADITKGDQALDDFLLDITSDLAPGGEAYQIQSNYDASQQYVQQLDQMVQTGQITNSQKRKWLEEESSNRFRGTNFDPTTGGFDNFRGIDAQADMDLFKYMDERMKGWKETALRVPKLDANGEPMRDPTTGQAMYEPHRMWEWTKMPNGQFYHEISGRMIDGNEVYEEMMQTALNDPTVKAYLGQEADIEGLQQGALITIPDGNNGVVTVDARDYYMNERLHRAASSIAEKHSFELYNDKVHKNWMLAQSRQHRHENDLARWEWTTQNAVGNITVTTPGVQAAAPSGSSLDDLRKTKEMGQQTASAGVADLTDLGVMFTSVLSAANKNRDPDNQLTLDNPEELYKAWRLKELNPGSLGYDPSLFSAAFGKIGEGLQMQNIAQVREDKISAQVRARDPDGAAAYDNYRQNVTDIANALNIPGVSASEIVTASENLSGPGSTFTSPNGPTFMKTTTGIDVFDAQNNKIASYSDDSSTGKAVTSIRDAYKAQEDYVLEYERQVNQELAEPIVYDAQSTTRNPAVTDAQVIEDQQAMQKYQQDPANFDLIINNAANLTEDQKEALRSSTNEGQFQGTPLHTPQAMFGDIQWHLTYVSKDANGNRTTTNIFLPATVVQTDGITKMMGTPEAKAGAALSQIRDNGIEGEPVNLVNYPYLDVSVRTQPSGQDVWGIKTPMSDQTKYVTPKRAAELLVAQEALINNVALANITMEQYYESVAGPLGALGKWGGRPDEYALLARQLNAKGINITTDGLAGIATNQTAELQREYAKTQTQPRNFSN